MARIIVTSALPYANGPIHFGHVVGAYLPADIYVRHRRMAGDDVHFVCGADEHGVAITLKAEQAGKKFEDYVDHWQAVIKDTLDAAGIEFDIFTGTAHHRNPYHRELAQGFFLDLNERGMLLEKSEEQFYSESLGRFLPDRYVQGTCYVCGFEQARGDECPKCGTWLEARRLGNPVCTLDGSQPVLKETRHWYLDLARIRDEWLGQWFEDKADEWKPNVLGFVREALKDLRERPITRDLDWGVPVPAEGTTGKCLYVWFDAPIGYLSISKQWFEQQGRGGEFEQWWKNSDTKLYHFIGKDNIVFHTVVFPSMLHGTGQGWIVPENVPANEFFNLEGRKFNTSAGWFIPEDAVRGRYPKDALRYALTTMMPETADSDWSWKEFQSRVNDDLADNLGNFVSRTLRFAERFLDGKIAELAEPTDDDRNALAAGGDAATRMSACLDRFQFREACRELMAYGRVCNKYYDTQQPWVLRKSDPDRCRQVIRVCAEMIRSLAVLCEPLMPDTGSELRSLLGLSRPSRWDDAGGAKLAGTIEVSGSPVLFPKVADEDVEAQMAALAEAARTMGSAAPRSAAPDVDPIAATVEFEQFAGVDLRAGTVTAAEKHPKADRLLVLEVDLGLERRTIVAGVAGSYPEPSALLGQRVVAVANLAPRKLRGVVSQGMLLATDDAEGKPRFVSPGQDAPNGTRVS